MLICIPAYGGAVTTGCMLSVIKLGAALQEKRIPSQVLTVDEVYIGTARNILASRLLVSQFGHLLFVDADIMFHPETVFKMLAANKEVIGCTYPKRELDLNKVVELAKTQENPVAKASTFAVNKTDWRGIEIKNGMCQVEGLGMGLCLIAKSALLQLAPTVRRDGDLYGFFDHLQLGNKVLGEDNSFFARWRSSGGEVWALVAEDIGHVGNFMYRARLIDALKA